VKDEPEGQADIGAEDPSPSMPKWVPVLIGAVLVAMAGLAIYTGIHYRNPPLANGIIRMRQPPRPATGGGAPGEPGPGASLVLPGESGDNAPSPNAPVNSRTRAVIRGGPEGIDVAPHLTARRGMIISAQPDDAMVYVNETPVGTAGQLKEPYEFPAPGSYTVRITALGYHDQQFVVTSSEAAATPEVVTLKASLKKQ
jgi:hypothetical protein